MTQHEIVDYQFHGIQPVLPVEDIDETLEFYRGTLGFEVDFIWGNPPTHARVSRGDSASGGPVRIQFTKGLRARPTMASCGWLTIHVGQYIERLYDEYCDREVKVVSELETKPWGLREFEIEDPNGHVLRFAGYMEDDQVTG